MKQDKDAWKLKVDLFRKRFKGREDLFAVRSVSNIKVIDPETQEERWEEKVMYAPKCTNYGDIKVCLIAKKQGICSECSHKQYQAMDDATVADHIYGNKDIAIYCLRKDEIKFGATDFDCGTVFEDAKATRDASLALGVPCYIARSSKKGYHVYWFFKDFIKAHLFTSFIRHIFQQLGFYERLMNSRAAGLPEVFPKQTILSDTGVGNCIKIPMIEPKMKEGFNCWVDDAAKPIVFEKQWDYFGDTEEIGLDYFNEVLTKHNIEILQAPASRTHSQARVLAGREAGHDPMPEKPFGKFLNIVEGCPAMREYWSKDESGRYSWDVSNPKGLFHAGRLASLLLAMRTTDGLEIIKKRWPGTKSEQHIQQAIATGYKPVTCAWMQERGVCHRAKHPKGDGKCMEKNPPSHIKNGVRIVNEDNLPEEQWSHPSPVRFATDNNLTVDDIIERIGLIYASMHGNDEETPTEIKLDAEGHPIVPVKYIIDNHEERVSALLSKVFTNEDKDKVKQANKANKWMLASEMNTRLRSAERERNEEANEKLCNELPSFSFNAVDYVIRDGGYHRSMLDAKGNRVYTVMTDFTVDIIEELIEIHLTEKDEDVDLTVENRYYRGVINYAGNKKVPFFEPLEKWNTTLDKWLGTIHKYVGGAVSYNRPDFDHIMKCICAFSKATVRLKKTTQETGYHRVKNDGGYSDVYLMPSVMISKDGITPNDQYEINLKSDLTKNLDFKILSDERLKELGRHLITDFFSCNNSRLTMSIFAHAMVAAILPQIGRSTGYRKSPPLWLAGSYSKGKTWVAEKAQNFYGNFMDDIMSSAGSAKAKLGVASAYRHAYMLIDDYKASVREKDGNGGIDIIDFIQSMYDRNSMPALKQDGTLRTKMNRAKGLAAVTGEDMPAHDASAVSRMLLLDVDLVVNEDAGNRVLENVKDYRGFTPHFIHYCFNVSDDIIAHIFREYSEYFEKPLKEMKPVPAASQRIAQNLSLNMLGFRLAMDMLVAKGAIGDVQRDALCRQHMINLEFIRETIVDRVQASKGSETFLEGLREILQDWGRYYIEGWPYYPASFIRSNSATCIGYYRQSTQDIVYIAPNKAHAEVSKLKRGTGGYLQAVGHIGRQLAQDGYLDLTGKVGSSFTKNVRTETGSFRGWPLKISVLGVEVKATENVASNEDEEQEVG